MIKFLLLILSVTQMSKCNNTKQLTPSPLLKVYRATSQAWSGGVVGSGKGINYQFYLPAADTVYAFDSAWVDGYRLALKRFSSTENKDTLILQASAFFSTRNFDGDQKTMSPDLAPLPAEKIKCAALLRYQLNKDQAIEYCVTVIQILPRINYP